MQHVVPNSQCILPSCTNNTPKNRPRNQIASMDHGVLQCNMYLSVDFVYVGGTWNNVELLGNCNWKLLAPPGTRMETHAGPRHILSDDMVAQLTILLVIIEASRPSPVLPCIKGGEVQEGQPADFTIQIFLVVSILQ